MVNTRNHVIDILRGLAILLVVFGHISHVPGIRTYIWGFHIPIFFFISGVLFNRYKFNDFISFLTSRIKNLLIPYVFFYLITLFYWILIERHFRGSDVSILSQFIGLGYGTYDLRYMLFNGALWFLPCLFTMETLYWFVSKQSKRGLVLTLIICYCLGIFLSHNFPFLPFGLCAALIAIPFYGLGDFCKTMFLNNSFERFIGGHIMNFLILVGLFFVQIMLMPWTGADLAALKINNPVLYIPIAIVGIGTFGLLSNIIKRNIVLEYLGRNSLVIFAFQEPVYRAIIFVFSKLVTSPVEEVRYNILYAIIITLISICCIVPLVCCWNEYLFPHIKQK